MPWRPPSTNKPILAEAHADEGARYAELFGKRACDRIDRRPTYIVCRDVGRRDLVDHLPSDGRAERGGLAGKRSRELPPRRQERAHELVGAPFAPIDRRGVARRNRAA